MQGSIDIRRWNDRNATRAAGRERAANQANKGAARPRRERKGRRGGSHAKEQHGADRQSRGSEATIRREDERTD